MCKYGCEEGRSATEIAAMMRLMAASAHESRKRHAIARSLYGSEAAFDRFTPRLLYDAMVDNATRPTVAVALLREQVWRTKHGELPGDHG